MKKLTTEDFIEKSIKIHGSKYSYLKTNYTNCNTKVIITCPKHGDFLIRPDHFYNGHGCPKCGHEHGSSKIVNTLEKFIETSNKVHNNEYDYSKVEYINARTKVCIICPEHGEFWQTPCNHLQGHGCQKCNESRLENEIKLFLEENKVKFEAQKRFEWLKHKTSMSLDFYLPDYNAAIECQGEQHFKHKIFFNNYPFEKRYEMDLLKNKLCKEHNITLLYYSRKSYVPSSWKGYKVIFDKNVLLENLSKIS